MSGLHSRKTSNPSPNLCATPGLKLSAATFDMETIFLAISMASGCFKFSLTDNLFAVT
jgi:hypothetical protein